MKLLELIGVKKFHDADLEAVLSSMSKTHYESGRGSFGVVLRSSKLGKSEVVKFWITDSAYDDFVKYVIAHPYKHFPKFYSKPKEISAFFTRPIEFPDKIKYIHMEELGSIPSGKTTDAVQMIFSDLAREKDVEGYIKNLNENLQKSIKDYIPDLPEFCREIHKMLKKILVHGNNLDIQEFNMMKRSNGELVITDPISNSKDSVTSQGISTALERMQRKTPVMTTKGRGKPHEIT